MQKRNVRRTSQRGERSRSTEQTKADEADYRASRRKQTMKNTDWTSERLRGGDGRKNTGRRAGREVLTQRSDAFSCAKGTNNDQIEDERTRRGGRAVEAGGLVGGRGGVRTGKAQPPRGRASSGEGGRRPSFFFWKTRWHVVML